MKKKNTIAIILARGGSKGIPGKNIKSFLGKPLLAWTVIQAKISKNISKVYLSSDSDKILKIGEKYGAIAVKRPKNISGDKARSEEAVLHLLQNLDYNPDGVVMLEPTAPLRDIQDIDNCINDFYLNKWDSGFSGAILEDFLIWKFNKKNKLLPINYNFKKKVPRQLRDPEVVENGSIYIFTSKSVKKNNNRFGGKIGFSVNQIWQSFEIDNIQDWKFVSLIFNRYLLKKYQKIKLKKIN
jgi:CMP-N,N'-diacetyllegionaminic acid synthase